MMKKWLLAVAMVACASTAQAEDFNFVSVEYAPFSNHLSDDNAPAGGYNEDNHIVTVKIGHEVESNSAWSYNYSAGLTTFDNSYDERSFGAGVGAEIMYDLTQVWSLYGGADLGLVSGYDGHVDDDYVLFDELIPFFVLNGGVEYDLGEGMPMIRAGMKYVPASAVDSDDVVAYSIGARFKLP